MKFSVKHDKQVMLKSRILALCAGTYETSDKEEIDKLSKVDGVEVEKATKKTTKPADQAGFEVFGMKRYTEQKTFSFNKLQEYRGVVPDIGASLAVEYYSGEDWVEDQASPMVVPNIIYSAGMTVRITPTGGGFSIDEAEGI